MTRDAERSGTEGRPSESAGEASRPGLPQGDPAAAFPWVGLLPEDDVRAFAAELAALARSVGSVGSVDDTAYVEQTPAAWRHTADFHADPELLAALTGDHDDCGPAPDPRDIA